MSINVTVTGNPVSIKKGKMVCSDPDYAKKEFDKRRLMRLEQVRQQSKEIAEDIRNKVRLEKCKQLGKIEKDGKKKLKEWQTRKLLELQNQYQEAIEDLGIGHKAAEIGKIEDGILENEKESNEKKAQERGRKALRNEINKNENITSNTRHKHSGLIERRKPLSPAKKKCFGKCKSKRRRRKEQSDSEDLKIDISDIRSVDSHNEGSNKFNSPSSTTEETMESSSCECFAEDSPDSESDEDAPVKENTPVLSNLIGKRAEKTRAASRSDASKKCTPLATKEKSIQVSTENRTNTVEISKPTVNPDTRISDRIKNRILSAKTPDYCDLINHRICNCSNFIINCDSFAPCRCNNNKKNQSTSYTPDRENHQEDIVSRDNQEGNEEIPTKPKIVLKSSDKISVQESKSKIEPPKIVKSSDKISIQESKSKIESPENWRISKLDSETVHKRDKDAAARSQKESTKASNNKIPYYDHLNKFTKQVEGSSHSEKIEPEDWRISPHGSDDVTIDTMYKRDKDAASRGQKALEKEKIQREYNELLKKLPLLQKQQRICEISSDKPEYHMSEGRLREVERRRQNKMDNAYEKAFPVRKPAIVTIPPKKHPNKEIDVTPFKIIGRGDNPPMLNLGTWDDDKFEEKTDTEKPVKSRNEQLKELLGSLNNQKQLLLKEIQDLPNGSNLTSLLDKFNSISSEGKEGQSAQKSKRKRSPNKAHTETDSETEKSQLKTPQPSPKKKAKIRPKEHLVLQNTGTQTSPKPETSASTNVNAVSDSEKLLKVDKHTNTSDVCIKSHRSCDCIKSTPESAEDLCRIIIKIKEDDKPEILIQKPKNGDDLSVQNAKDAQQIPTLKEKKAKPKKKGESVITEKSVLDSIPLEIKQKTLKTLLKDRFKVLEQTDHSEPKDSSKPTSWREQLSKNSSNTTSTSYYSPPDFSKYKNSSEQFKQMKSLLKDKPQQLNLSADSSRSSSTAKTTKQLDPRLLKYIQKLITMSRSGVEELGVSSVSEVSTPSESIMNIESNKVSPLTQLQNVIKYFNLTEADLKENLTFSTDTSEMSRTQNLTVSSSDSSGMISGKSPKSGETTCKRCHKPQDCACNSETPAVVSDFTKIAETCSKRISNLTEMIEKVRKEKQKILESPTGSSDKDHTAYYDLPTYKGSPDEVDKLSDKEAQEELDKKLLEIDYSLSDKLKRLDPSQFKHLDLTEIKKLPVVVETQSSNEELNDQRNDDLELFQRLQNLLVSPTQSMSFNPVMHSTQNSDKTVGLSLVPENNQQHFNFGGDFSKTALHLGFGDMKFHKRPPLSKGLTIARRFNGNISTVPHELSTIIEADSQQSLKLDTVSPRNNSVEEKQTPTDVTIKQKTTHTIVTNPNATKSKTSSSNDSSTDVVKEINKLCSESRTDVSPKITDLSKNILIDSSSISSEDKSDMDAVETMLKSIGMQWAISTLRKTKEALALTSSSSSSMDMDKQKKVLSGDSSNISEISLKDFLSQQLIAKISSSTLKSDASPNSLLGDSQEISAIQNVSAGRTDQRTSTPIQSSKSTEKSKASNKPTFSGESELSSVKDTSQDKPKKITFYSLSESKD